MLLAQIEIIGGGAVRIACVVVHLEMEDPGWTMILH